MKELVDYEFSLPHGFGAEDDIELMFDDRGNDKQIAFYYKPIAKACQKAGLAHLRNTELGAVWRGTMEQVNDAMQGVPEWANNWWGKVKYDA
jgi:hypothetical protein